MVFSSTLFLFVFLPVTLAGYYILKGGGRNLWLLVASIIFFSWSQPYYLWVILLNIVINYGFALIIERLSKRLYAARKLILILDVLANLGILFYFKYFVFTMEIINDLFLEKYKMDNIILPIGISFFTFQSMSYVIDVYRNDVQAEKNPVKVALYILMFPQLIAGPIVRYIDIFSEITDRRVTLDDAVYGVEKFIIGLGKKAIVANTMGTIIDRIWSNGINQSTALTLWIGSLAYTLQIYYDFSGYSDMAIGLGRMMGFHFKENFRHPYMSRSVSEFWRRWHISLGTWIRDYVYI